LISKISSTPSPISQFSQANGGVAQFGVIIVYFTVASRSINRGNQQLHQNEGPAQGEVLQCPLHAIIIIDFLNAYGQCNAGQLGFALPALDRQRAGGHQRSDDQYGHQRVATGQPPQRAESTSPTGGKSKDEIVVTGPNCAQNRDGEEKKLI
jgi:hypothetical protein